MNLTECSSVLRDALSQFPSSVPVLMHTDLARVGIYEPDLGVYLQHVVEGCGGRPLLLPTFNYDYYKTRRFDVQRDVCQVGALNEYARIRTFRTPQPVYSFAIIGEPSVTWMLPRRNPLDECSVFGGFTRRSGMVVFWGAEFNACTFLHHIEEIAGVPYRRDKAFPGTVIDSGRKRRLYFHHRVRPQDVRLDIDWVRLESELYKAWLLHVYPLDRGCLRVFDAMDVRQWWLRKLKHDPLYFLTAESRERKPNDW